MRVNSKQMKVLILGANGGIGRFAVKAALGRGYKVVAYVRRDVTCFGNPDGLEVRIGTTSDTPALLEAMRGCDAVINCIGVSMRLFHEDVPAVEANRAILSAMRRVGVSRYVTWATPSVRSREDVRSYVTVLPGLLASVFLPKAKKCISRIVSDVERSNLQWTVVRFMAPKDRAASGTVKVSFGDKRIRFGISRADIASFMVSQLSTDEYVGRMPIIGS